VSADTINQMNTAPTAWVSTPVANPVVGGGVISEQDAVRRLVGRLGLGPRPGDLGGALAAGFATTLTTLTTPPASDPGVAATPVPALGATTRVGKAAGIEARKAQNQELAAQGRALGVWWLDRMAAVEAPFPERMTWFWHTHFATSIQKVKFARLMYLQNDTFRTLGRGDFRTLAQAMIIDPAMLIWLDGQGNRAGKPNENLAREFMELFSLGVGNYTENDVREAARALTGWRLNYTSDTPFFAPHAHDLGPESVLGRSGSFDAPALVNLLVQEPASPKFVATRIWTRFVSDTPPDAATMGHLLSAYGPGHDITALLRAAVSTVQFRDRASVLVKEPVLWLVGALRALRLSASTVPSTALRAGVTGLGQVPFAPPSVGGWPAGVPWLTTAAALTRLRLAQQLTAHGDISVVSRTSPTGRIDATAALLGLGGFTDRSAAALKPLTGQPAQLVGLALTAPEYSVSA
jgi:uncharacterized protein (DUF1800 family)